MSSKDNAKLMAAIELLKVTRQIIIDSLTDEERELYEAIKKPKEKKGLSVSGQNYVLQNCVHSNWFEGEVVCGDMLGSGCQCVYDHNGKIEWGTCSTFDSMNIDKAAEREKCL